MKSANGMQPKKIAKGFLIFNWKADKNINMVCRFKKHLFRRIWIES